MSESYLVVLFYPVFLELWYLFEPDWLNCLLSGMLTAALDGVQIICLVILIALKAQDIYNHEQLKREGPSLPSWRQNIEPDSFLQTCCGEEEVEVHPRAATPTSSPTPSSAPAWNQAIKVVNNSAIACMLCKRGFDTVC